MSELVRDETPMEFFREQLERAMEHQKVSTSAFTEYYLVNLLSACVQATSRRPSPASTRRRWPSSTSAPCRPRAASARACCGRWATPRLFVSGFFADSLSRGLVDLGLLQGDGRPRVRAAEPRGLRPRAWARPSSPSSSGRFCEFADVLAEVSETSRLGTNTSVLRLYERWVQTGSRRAAVLLAERGIAPVLPGDGRPQ